VEENNLIKKCQRGDKEAFQLLISQYHPFIYKFLVKITNNDQIAEDLTQETFLKVIRTIEKFDTTGQAKFSTYVISIAKNAYIDYLRKEKRFKQNIPIPENFGFIVYLIYKQNNLTCYKCGALQSKFNSFCSNCGSEINKSCHNCKAMISKL